MARGETYEEFVGKFNKENPKTTDDCYTPREIYEVVLDWAKEHLNIGDRPVVRPFYPGGDFENYDYPENCVVVDNPPFSIFARILRWYNERGIDFFLFAPSLTGISQGVTFVSTDSTIIYENGAIVKTSFVTNMMGDLLCITAPDLSAKIEETTRKLNNKKRTTHRKKYIYPKNVLRVSMLNSMARRGIHFVVSSNDGTIFSRISTQRRGEFGNSIILSDSKQKEREELYYPPKKIHMRPLNLNSPSRPRPRLSDLTRWTASTTHNITIDYARY